MKVLELFAGTRSIGKAFEARGHEVFSIEWDKRFENIDLYADVLTVTAHDIIEKFGYPDVIWASPDCTTYSVAAISKHRRKEPNGNLAPVSEYAKFCDTVNAHVIELINELNPRYYFIENPRGGLRKMGFMQGLPRYTVTYCQYGERGRNLRTFGQTIQTRNSSRRANVAHLAMMQRHAVQRQAHKRLKTRPKRRVYQRFYVNTL